MLRDTVRNRAFYRALKNCVTSDSVVLDIGAGTGIWAITAAKLGAKKVVAVEPDELLIGLIYALAQEHGVREKIEAVGGVSFDVKLQREFDIIISETVGYLGYDENIVEIMRDARSRFLKDGGLLIPETISLFAAAAHLKNEAETVPGGLPFDFKLLAALNFNSPRTLNKRRDLKIITKPQRLIKSDLYETNELPELKNLRAKWKTRYTGQINCFIVWVESQLTETVKLDTRQTSSWQPNIYRIEPVEGDFEAVEFDLSLTVESNYWSATFSGARDTKTQSYSPEFAAADLTLYKKIEDLSIIEQIKASRDT